jgi:diguanylate cyclase (GGDEF)-like protein
VEVRGTVSPLKAVRTLLAEDQRSGYANVDIGRAARLGSVLWLIGAVCVGALLPIAPPTASTDPSVGWLIAGALLAGCLLTAVRLLAKGARLDPRELYAMSFAAIGAIAVLEWLAGGPGTPYPLLYLLSVVYTSCAHPPRQVLAYLVVLAPVMTASLVYGNPSGADAAAVALQYALSVGLGAVGLVLMSGLRAQRATLRLEGHEARETASRDFLTGLGNRRRLMSDLERVATPGHAHAHVFALFDLDGFKAYNDSFGHAAGDKLLMRLADRLAGVMADRGSTYRMGGDEFCIIVRDAGGAAHDAVARAAAALTAQGEGFTVACSYGAVHLPDEAESASEALRIADQRMYAQKSRGRTSAGHQSTEVLLRVLSERDPALGTHLDDVAFLCRAVAEKLGMGDEEVTPLLQAASLHDVGKAAIPDSILNKPGPLNDDEWAFMHRHTLIGERILSAAPALTEAARLVRSSHERWDGGGYPDGLAGEEIPLGSRVISVCDAFDAMTSARPYRDAIEAAAALAELRRCAGTQFDRRVVNAFGSALFDMADAASDRESGRAR